MNHLDEATARTEICRVGRSLFDRGRVHGTAGNISVRLADGFLITPTDACLGTLEPQALARVGADGVQTGGEPASKTLALHRRIYAAADEAASIVHTHSTPLVALSLRASGPCDDFLPPITPYFVMKVGHLPLIGYGPPGDAEVADRVVQAIESARARGAPIRAVMLDRLGPTVWHRTPALAMATLEEIDETARLVLSLDGAPAGAGAPLSADRIAALREHFNAPW